MDIVHGLMTGHVLQRSPRGARATVTGTCAETGAVAAIVRKGRTVVRRQAKAGSAADGQFTAIITGLPTGGPYRVEFTCGRSRVEVDDVFVGDLWLMAGQSNMEGVGNMVDAPEPHLLVRSFTMARTWELAQDPLNLMRESPDPVHHHGGVQATPAQAAIIKRRARSGVGKGVGVGVYFGKLMHARTGVPQGLIATAHGGTGMHQWDPALRDRGGESFYGSMWLSLQEIGQPIAGVLWYQGCFDASPEWVGQYTKRMQDLVAAVRRDLGQPRLPWLMVQIARVISDSNDVPAWNGLQEQQRVLPDVIPHLAVVPAIDLEIDDGIHIGGRAFGILAKRLASAARRHVLHDRSEPPAIQPVSARLLGPSAGNNLVVEVRFAHVVGGLVSDGLARGFSVHDPAGTKLTLLHKIELDGDRARLCLNCRVSGPLTVSYGHGLDPVCTIHDQRDMGLPVFQGLPVVFPAGVSDWFLRWRVTPVQPGEDIGTMPRPSDKDPSAVDRSFPPLFANLRPDWQGRSGHAAFHGWMDVPEDMRLEVRLGYDGPIRLWIGAQEVHTDLGGTNPALPDATFARCAVKRGRQRVTILMALNGGAAWGVYLRVQRLGIKTGSSSQPPTAWR